MRTKYFTLPFFYLTILSSFLLFCSSCLKSPEEEIGPADEVVGDWRAIDSCQTLVNGDTIRYGYSYPFKVRKMSKDRVQILYGDCEQQSLVTKSTLAAYDYRCNLYPKYIYYDTNSNMMVYNFQYENKGTVWVKGSAYRK